MALTPFDPYKPLTTAIVEAVSNDRLNIMCKAIDSEMVQYLENLSLARLMPETKRIVKERGRYLELNDALVHSELQRRRP